MVNKTDTTTDEDGGENRKLTTSIGLPAFEEQDGYPMYPVDHRLRNGGDAV